MYSPMCSIEIFVDRLFAWLKYVMATFSTFPDLGVKWDRRWTINPFDSPPLNSNKLPIDTYGLSLTVFSHLAGPITVSVRPSDPDTMTMTATEQ